MSHVDGVDRGVGYGVSGRSHIGDGVRGGSWHGKGVWGTSGRGAGVYGEGVSGYGVRGGSSYGPGVYGFSSTGDGVVGESPSPSPYPGAAGVLGINENGYGVRGASRFGTAVYGVSDNATGVAGYSDASTGVYGFSNTGYGVIGESAHLGATAVFGVNQNGYGVQGFSSFGYGVAGLSIVGTGVYASSNTGDALKAFSVSGLAAFLDGRVRITGGVDISGPVTMTGPVDITGPLTKPGGSFKIDHPLDPANKYLYHSFVESPDMKNVYDGVVVLDDKGEAEIELPDWFGALNKDFRYQLTAIGAPGPNLHISEEIPDGATTNYSRTRSNKNNNNSRFKVAGGISGMKVSWQVTGIRKDPYANAHRIPVEEDKPAKERGYYTYPELYGQPEERGIISHLLFPTDEEEKKELPLLINDENKLTT